MKAALALAARGLGRVWPNPAVGCLLVRDGRAVGRGWTQPGGRPHAEAEALARAGAAAQGCTAYVCLEPCAHHGVTPPCAEALVAAGIARAVVAIGDPDPRVDGRGLAVLRGAGVTVETGICGDEAAELNAGFISRISRRRPLVTLKLATTLDGRIATAAGESRWITGAPARARVHLMRAESDAVLIGAGTAAADDPELTVRLPGLDDRSPVRVVVDRQLRLDPAGKLVGTAGRHPVWLITRSGGDDRRKQRLVDRGVDVIEVGHDGAGLVDLAQALAALAGRGITRLLVEGGAKIAASLIGADLVDRLAWFRAPVLIGGDGRAAADPFGLDDLASAPRFRRLATEAVGDDMLETYARNA